MSSALHDSAEWTSLQGQYLAFIYAYTTIHNQAPAERDMQQFFHVTPPTVHNMLKLLEHHGFIRRCTGSHCLDTVLQLRRPFAWHKPGGLHRVF